MERVFYIGIGFVIAVVLVGAFFAVKDAVENKKTLLEQKVISIARKECRDAKANIYWHHIIGLEQRVNRLIDSKLAEKEREHESDRC